MRIIYFGSLNKKAKNERIDQMIYALFCSRVL